MKPLLVYAPGYDLSLPGLDLLHPFDGRIPAVIVTSGGYTRRSHQLVAEAGAGSGRAAGRRGVREC